MDWPKIWYGDSSWLRTLLTPASWLYAGGWQIYRAAYDLGIKRASRPYPLIVCVGNLTVGGSGKTPVTLHIASVLQELGYEVAVSMSGYGAPHAEAAMFAPPGPLSAAEWGDEPALARTLHPSLDLIVGRRRVLAAQLMHERFTDGKAVFLMDDGFQHLPLAKTVSIVLDPPTGNTRCLPAGPYREPRSNLRRATLVIGGGTSKFRVESHIAGWVDLNGKAVSPPVEAHLLCAIGRPQQFVEAVRATGIRVLEVRTLPDHDPLTAGNLFASLPGPVVVTSKDAVKLRERPDADHLPVFVARHEVVIEPAPEFRAFLKESLNSA